MLSKDINHRKYPAFPLNVLASLPFFHKYQILFPSLLEFISNTVLHRFDVSDRNINYFLIKLKEFVECCIISYFKKQYNNINIEFISKQANFSEYETEVFIANLLALKLRDCHIVRSDIGSVVVSICTPELCCVE